MKSNIEALRHNRVEFPVLAIENTDTAIAVVEYRPQADGTSKNYRLDFANPAFQQLAGLLDNPKALALMRQATRSWQRQISHIHFQQDEISMVLEMSAIPANGQLVITINDVTKLSHGQEMLELQTTLMDDHTRSLELVRSALETEITRRVVLEKKLRRLADTDMLSGLANRRSFMERSTSEFRRSRRYGHELSLVMIDLDKFKSVNDTHGHAAGDAVILAVGQICQSLSRNGVDVIGRIGGEEFAVLLPETGRDGAHKFAERLRLVIETTPIFADITKIMITASMGIATLDDDDHDIMMVLKRADKALYQSKAAGRNRVSAG